MLGHDRREPAAILVRGASARSPEPHWRARGARSPTPPPRRRLTAARANPARRPDRYALNQRRLADARVAAQQQTAVVAVGAECRTGSPRMRGPAADALPIAENYLIGARHRHRPLVARSRPMSATTRRASVRASW